MSSDAPSHIGRYRLGETLGQGGMGRVYSATLEGPGGFEKRVALKVLKRQAAQSPAAREALFREARLGALLRHPNLVDIYELGEADGNVFIAMELVDGPTVADLLRRRLLPAKAAVEIARQACTGLAHAHELVVRGEPAPVVHRDIKPSNILIDPTGLVKIADLGIASLAGPSQRVEGTRGYMSPEQCAGEPLDARSDVFSIGILLWSMVLGHSPLRADSLPATFVNTLSVEKLLADPSVMSELGAVDPQLPTVVARCLRRDPEDRFPSARALARELRGVLRHVRGDSLLDIVSDEEDDADPDSVVWVSLPAPDTVSLQRNTAPSLQPIQQPDTPFVGRQKASQVLETLVMGGSARVVTVDGAAGVGKSRLVQHTLAGVPMLTYADLFGLADRHAMLEALARCLSIPVGVDDTDSLHSMLAGSLRRRSSLVVVLDNADGVAEPLAAFLSELTTGARFVVSARQALRIEGEQRLGLKPMPADDARELFEALAGRRPDTAEEEKAQRVLLGRLGGLPLAIELAASQARSQSIVALLSELDEQFRLLEHASRSRHSTVSDTVRWSWQLLGGGEQAALSQLTVFEGSFTVEGADAIIDTSHLSDAPWALDLLTALAHHSLVQTINTKEGPRFRLYPAVRAFAREQLADEEASRLRHARWFARWGGTAARGRPYSAGGPRYLRSLLDVLPDLQSACQWAASHRRPELAGLTFLAAADVILVRGPLRAGLELAASVSSLRGLQLLRSEVLIGVGNLHVQAGDLASAIKRLSDAARIARRTDDPLREGQALTHRALVQQQLGKPTRALEDAQQATELADGRDLRLHGVTLANLGVVYRVQGQLEPAKSVLRQAMATLEAAGDAADTAIALGTLGNVYRDEGRYQASENTLLQSLGLHRRVGNLRSECITLGNLGALLLKLERLAEAETALRSALELAENLGYSSAEAVFIGRLGELLRRTGRAEQAARYLERAQVALRELGDSRGMAESMVSLARLHRESGRTDEARQALEEAWDQVHPDGALGEQAAVAVGLARLPMEGRAVDRSLQRLMGVRRALQQSGDTLGTGTLLVEEAGLMAQQGNRRTAAARDWVSSRRRWASCFNVSVVALADTRLSCCRMLDSAVSAASNFSNRAAMVWNACPSSSTRVLWRSTVPRSAACSQSCVSWRPADSEDPTCCRTSDMRSSKSFFSLMVDFRSSTRACMCAVSLSLRYARSFCQAPEKREVKNDHARDEKTPRVTAVMVDAHAQAHTHTQT